MNENEALCPYCGAPVQQNAAFCLHCMKSLDTKTEIKKKKSAPKKLIIIIAAVLLLCSAAVCAAVVIVKSPEPVCTPEAFLEAAGAASEKLGSEKLWQPDGLVQTNFNKKENDSVYHTESTLSAAGVSVAFKNGGEAVDIALCDIKKADLESAYKISESALSAAFGHYIDELSALLRDTAAYPRTAFDAPFEAYFTEPIKRTERYIALAESGDIRTEYLQANTDGGRVLLCFFTEHTENGETLYDLYFEIQ